MFHRISLNFVFICFILARAIAYNVKGNETYRRKDFSDAIRFYTEGIEVNCKDDELKAKLYSNRAKAHFRLGEMFEFFSVIFWSGNGRRFFLKAVSASTEPRSLSLIHTARKLTFRNMAARTPFSALLRHRRAASF